jgi:peptidoglycan/xylan/chitin deacetylase (PgdA/CDA1 family)
MAPAQPTAETATLSERAAARWRHVRFTGLVPARSSAILMYHAVGEPGAFANVSVERFERDLAFLTERYRVAPLETLVDVATPPTEPTVAITFDDGFASVYEHALPLLRAYDAPATVFALAGDPRPGEPTIDADRLLTDAQLRDLATDDLVTIGNHTVSHPDLSTVDSPDRLETEIVGAKATLEDRLGIDVDLFSYPYGTLSPAALERVRASHRAAVTTHSRPLSAAPDRHRLPRISAVTPALRVGWLLRDLGLR